MLVPNPKGWSIVVLGGWNTRILTPAWLANGRLTQAAEIEVAVPMDELVAPRVYGFDGIKLEVQSTRIAVRVNQPENELLLKAQSSVVRLLTDLTHTPLTAVGTNFSFIDEDPSAAITHLFDVQDNGRIAEEDWVVTKTTISRSLRQGETVLNLQLILQPDGKVRFDLNYHLATSSNDAARAEIQKDIVARKDASRQLLDRLYYTQ